MASAAAHTSRISLTEENVIRANKSVHSFLCQVPALICEVHKSSTWLRWWCKRVMASEWVGEVRRVGHAEREGMWKEEPPTSCLRWLWTTVARKSHKSNSQVCCQPNSATSAAAQSRHRFQPNPAPPAGLLGLLLPLLQQQMNCYFAAGMGCRRIHPSPWTPLASSYRRLPTSSASTAPPSLHSLIPSFPPKTLY